MNNSRALARRRSSLSDYVGMAGWGSSGEPAATTSPVTEENTMACNGADYVDMKCGK